MSVDRTKCAFCGIDLKDTCQYSHTLKNITYTICKSCFIESLDVRPEDWESYSNFKRSKLVPVVVKKSMTVYTVLIIIGCIIATVVSLFMEHRNGKK